MPQNTSPNQHKPQANTLQNTKNKQQTNSTTTKPTQQATIISASDYERVAKEIQFPLKIHGTTGSGASYTTLRLITNMIQNGYKFVFFSAKFQAKQSLMKMLMEEDFALVMDLSRLSSNLDKKVILVEGFDQKTIETALDWVEKNRIVVIKNIEELLDDLEQKHCHPELVSGSKELESNTKILNFYAKLNQRKSLILSGDWDQTNLQNFKAKSELLMSPLNPEQNNKISQFQAIWKIN